MFPLPRKLPRALCALSLTCAMTVSPVLATQPGASSAPADPWADLCPKVLPVKEHQEETVLSLEETPALPEVPSAVQEESVQSVQPPHYLRYTPLLLERGYSHQEIDALLAVLPSVRIPVLVRSSYSALAVELIQQEHFNSMCLERYLKYAQANPTLTAADMVTRVNIGLDNMWYSNVRFVQDPTAINALVNKYHYLRPTYTPELVPMSSWYASYNAYMHPEAYEWFTKMVDDARAEGLKLYCVSAYRSYSYQNTLYQRYVRQDGRTLADTYSARPGYSEHQTGLAVDINTASSSAHFENTEQYRWLSENSWKYGFILRYPEGKEDITGFMFEPWHYRYVGHELAKAIYESGLTYEEYLAGAPAQAPTVEAVQVIEPAAELPTTIEIQQEKDRKP